MCEIPKIPKIYDYIGDKMGIIQNEVVWIKIKGQPISLCIVNFAIIAKFRYDSEFSLCTVTFAMIAKFRYHSENMAITKFR